ncbi:adenosine deaminase [Xanthomonas campestris pv. phormiicola]|nr:adenosine deaminase [Xanthomonas campestris pv. phormiicola]UYC18507.1 adenosine deaminase [Xanthomonas campestris pv. phormiicola]
MPKGGDLHNHLSGSVYAEDFLRWADEDGDCVSLADYRLRAPPCGADQAPARGLAARDPALYARTVDALSMRNFVAGQPQFSGHDRFFSTFGKFQALGQRRVEALAAVLEQAARDHVGYVELIVNPSAAKALAEAALRRPWQPGQFAAESRQLDPALPAAVAASIQELDQVQARLRERLRCDTAQARPGCAVSYRYLAYADRAMPQAYVFAQIALGYALVKADPRFVGVNIVDPEDNPVALADYRAHMAMFAFFAARDPQVRLSLHAGELTLGLVPPAELGFHIREAVAAGAQRIGHGVDIAYEDDAPSLLAQMRRRRVAVEINLTSNDVILGVKGVQHPLSMYLRAGVPLVLSTDDAGVSRSDLTHEYQRAVQEQGLDYPALKQIARNALRYAFLPGDSIWAEDGTVPSPACAAPLAAAVLPRRPADPRCAALLQASEKARLQWQLEADFAAFETRALRSPY